MSGGKGSQTAWCAERHKPRSPARGCTARHLPANDWSRGRRHGLGAAVAAADGGDGGDGGGDDP